jgi:Family of unknown function (DUF6516)
MKATSLLRNRITLDDDCFVEVVVWQLPRTLPGSLHNFKYRLALVSDQKCVLRNDNEAGKGDHRHIDDVELGYNFQGLERLQSDFWDDVENWRAR